MSKEVTDVLKENLLKMVSADQKQDLLDIFSREVEIPPTGELDVETEEDEEWDLNDYIDDEWRAKWSTYVDK